VLRNRALQIDIYLLTYLLTLILLELRGLSTAGQKCYETSKIFWRQCCRLLFWVLVTSYMVWWLS